jgi:hypothetical protein
LDIFEKYNGVLAGTTNQLFLNFPKAKADLVINVDTNEFIFPKEPTDKLKAAMKHTSHEKVFAS